MNTTTPETDAVWHSLEDHEKKQHARILETFLRQISLNLCGFEIVPPQTDVSMVYAFVEGEIIKQSDRADKAERERDEARKELASERDVSMMRLVAISTASISNTPTSYAELNKIHADYDSMVFQDVKTAMAREIKLIEERDTLRKVADLLAFGCQNGLTLGGQCKLNPTAYIREINEALTAWNNLPYVKERTS